MKNCYKTSSHLVTEYHTKFPILAINIGTINTKNKPKKKACRMPLKVIETTISQKESLLWEFNGSSAMTLPTTQQMTLIATWAGSVKPNFIIKQIYKFSISNQPLRVSGNSLQIIIKPLKMKAGLEVTMRQMMMSCSP